MEEQERHAWHSNITVRYLAEASLYDRVHPALTNAEEVRRLDRFLVAAMRVLPANVSLTSLDVGAGTGFVTERLHAWGFRVIATDLSAAMLGRLRRRLPGAVRAGHVTCELAEAETFLATHPDRYAVITIRAALHHLPHPASFVRLCAERLVEGGVLLILHEPVSTTRAWWMRLLLACDWMLACAFQLSFDDVRLYRQIGIDPAYRDAHSSPPIAIEEIRAVARALGLVVVASERAASAHTRCIRWLLRLAQQKTTWNVLLQRPLSTSYKKADFSE